MSNDPLASIWKINRVSVFTEAMKLANSRQEDDGRARFVAQRKKPAKASYLPVVEPPMVHEAGGGLAIRIAAMAVAVIALSAFAAFGLSA